MQIINFMLNINLLDYAVCFSETSQSLQCNCVFKSPIGISVIDSNVIKKQMSENVSEFKVT